MVAVSESKLEIAETSGAGRGRGGGRENNLEVLRRLAVGDNLRKDIVGYLAECMNDSPKVECRMFLCGISGYTAFGPLPGE